MRACPVGTQRRIALALGYGVTCSAGILPAGYAGLDRRGRVIDLHYRNGSGDTLHRYQYGYDQSGNREFARVTQWGVSDLHDNDRSSHYAYDGLQRLTEHELGVLDSGNLGTSPGDLPLLSVDWMLDNLGNWSGDANQHSVRRTSDSGTGVPVTEYVHHTVGSSNAISAVVQNAGTPGASTTAVLNDPNGNLVWDGTYLYQYDAWNRLMQVNLPGTAVLDANGRISAGQIGELVARCVYDGVGRLIRKSQLTAPGATTLQIEDYYYDGVRRIQERVQNPVPGEGGKETPGPLDDGGEPGEALELDEGSVGVVSGDPTPIGTIWVDREYIYGPDYVDEFVAQIDANGAPIYMLQDANYDVVGLLNENGVVVAQYTYEAYGALVQAESLARHVINKVGHQGLFFERYDGEPGQPILVPGAKGLYYNRNRWYDPIFGRFTSKDPNETALPVMTALAMNGSSLDVVFGGFNVQQHYADGLNLYGYLDANPVNHTDPSGLDFDWFGEVDDTISGMYADQLAFAAVLDDRMATGVNLGMLAGAMLISMIPGADAVKFAGKLYSGTATLEDGIWAAVSFIPGAGGAKAAAKLQIKTLTALGRYAAKGRKIGRALGLAEDAAQHLLKILPYKQAQKLTAGFGGDIMAHHLVEVRHFKWWGSKANTDLVPAVILDRATHKLITKTLQDRLPTRIKHSRDEVWVVYQEVYSKYPDWLQAIAKYFP